MQSMCGMDKSMCGYKTANSSNEIGHIKGYTSLKTDVKSALTFKSVQILNHFSVILRMCIQYTCLFCMS